MLLSAPAGAKNRLVGPARDHDRSTVGFPVDMAGKFDRQPGTTAEDVLRMEEQ